MMSRLNAKEASEMMSRGIDILNVKGRLALALGILFIAGLVLTNVMANAASAESAGGSVSAVGLSNAKIIFDSLVKTRFEEVPAIQHI